MQVKYLQNGNGRVIGRLETSDNGDQRLFNESNRMVGQYIACVDCTQKANGAFVAKGNIVMTLL